MNLFDPGQGSLVGCWGYGDDASRVMNVKTFFWTN
jgi:hypothetical protein